MAHLPSRMSRHSSASFWRLVLAIVVLCALLPQISLPSARPRAHAASPAAVISVTSAASAIDYTWGSTVITVSVTDGSGDPLAGIPLQLKSSWFSPDLQPSEQTPYGSLANLSGITNNSGIFTTTFSDFSQYNPNPVTITAAMTTPVSLSASTTVRIFPNITNAGPNNGGQFMVRYLGTTTSAPMFMEYLPADYTPTRLWPMVIILHGGLGTALGAAAGLWLSATNSPSLPQHDVMIFPNGRPIPGDTTGTTGFWFDTYPTSTLDAPTQHNESDVLKMIPFMERNANIDPQRISLWGHSMGGTGMFGLALRNPGIFAAGAETGGPTDLYNFYPFFNIIGASYMWILQELFGDPLGPHTALVDTAYHEVSARFLMENAMNFPFLLQQGEADTVVPDQASIYPSNYPYPLYEHGHDVIDVHNFTDNHGTTLSISQLAAQFPGSYVYSATFDAGASHSLNLLPSFSYTNTLHYLSQYTLPSHPSHLMLKTYDSVHTTYWKQYPSSFFAQLQMANPDNGSVAATLAITPATPSNTATIALSATQAITLDVANLGLSTQTPLTLTLSGPPSSGPQTLILTDTAYAGVPSLAAIGQTPPPTLTYSANPQMITISGISFASGPLTLVLHPASSGTPTPTNIPTNSSIPTNSPTVIPTNSPTITSFPSDTPTPSATPPATATMIPTATIAVSPTNVLPFQLMTVMGTNFGGNDSIQFFWDNGTTAIFTGTTKTAGAFIMSLGVPLTPGGMHVLTAVDQKSGQTASTTLWVNPAEGLSPSAASAGATVAIQGAGFAPDEVVKAYWRLGGPLLGTTTSDSLGSFSGPSAMTFTVPMSGTSSYNIYSIGQTSHATGFATFKLISTP